MGNLLGKKVASCTLLVAGLKRPILDKDENDTGYWIKTKGEPEYWKNAQTGLFGRRGTHSLPISFRRWVFGDGVLVFAVGVGFIPTRPGIALGR
jgi:hypothetical protein